VRVKVPEDPESRVAVVYSDDYTISLFGLEQSYVFDIGKYRRIHRELVRAHLADAKDVLEPAELDEATIRLVHTDRYLATLKDPEAVAEYVEFAPVRHLPSGVVDSMLLRPIRCNSAGTVLACRKAVEKGIGINIGGGYHHAEPDTGGGFCVYADIPIAVACLRRDGFTGTILIVDADLHQGNGNAVAFARDPSVFTLSIHEEDNYPTPKAKSDLDVGLSSGVGDREYLRIFKETVDCLLDDERPGLVIYVAGTDVYFKDELGGLALTETGILERDLFVVDEARRREVPIVIVLGGGYSQDSWRLHYRMIADVLRRYGGAERKT